ncbi:hypothetical protein, partial [Protofrankia coriariae]
MTTVVRTGFDPGLWARCHRTAREEGLAPGLAALREALLPGLIPCGPGGHAVMPAALAGEASRLWVDGMTTEDHVELETLGVVDLPGGPVAMLGHSREPGHVGAFSASAQPRTLWLRGLLWLRLGLSEGLRDACVTYLAGRTVGSSVLLQQQLVKGALADVLLEHLEIRAVITSAGERTEDTLGRLHEQITDADRELLHLLGASGYLAGGTG